jgi:putative Mg2+ transporter-C (MgtC) family protein
LSLVIGLDRERQRKPAGMRTNMLVGVGSCLFAILSIEAFPDVIDNSRVAAQIVTGIGFLGGGVIFKSKGEIHDITTAASIWTTAAIGMAVGTGAWFLGIVATIIIWAILSLLLLTENRIKD